jgi:hypothetical protein
MPARGNLRSVVGAIAVCGSMAAVVAAPVRVVITAVMATPVGVTLAAVMATPIGVTLAAVMATPIGVTLAAVMSASGTGAPLPVVALLVDMARGARLVAIELRTLARRHDAVGARATFLAPDRPLFASQPGGFAAGQLTGCDAFANATALTCLARVDAIAVRSRPIAVGPRHLGIGSALARRTSSIAPITLLRLREAARERGCKCQRNDDFLHDGLLSRAARPDAVRLRDQCADARQGQLCEMVTNLFPRRRACKRL